MQRLQQWILYFVGVIMATVAHLFFAYVLSYPASLINILFIFILLILLIRESGIVVWFAFGCHFIIELYSTTPFGVILLSATSATLITYWTYKRVFTNRSWYAGAILSALCITQYRVLYVLTLSSLRLFGIGDPVPYRPLMTAFVWEVLLTSVIVGISYLVIMVVVPSIRPSSVVSRQSRIFRL
jgi:hypothetical protein